MRQASFAIVVIALIAGWIFWDNAINSPAPTSEVAIAPVNRALLTPNWQAIAAWPPAGSDQAAENQAQARPDPWQVTTLIILDDSGSMRNQMSQAKQAVVEAIAQLDRGSRVGVIALNAGMVMPVTDAADAAERLPNDLAPIGATGNTPLGASLSQATAILTEEARQQRGFGVFRILVTTDGQATDGRVMNDAVARILSRTPIELATIGLGIGEGHALNVPGFTSYVSVGSVDELAKALQAAAAEQTVFNPITQFEN